MIVCLFMCIIFCGASESGDLFHEGSKITFRPDNRADFFGYTVIFGESGLIVGAPRASISQSSMSSGVVFTCSLENLETRNVTCQPLKLESDGRFSSTRDFFRDDMWFGATMAVVPDKKLLICAPRFAKPYRDRHLLANGACYLQTKRQSLPIYPLREMKNQAYMTNGLRKEYGAYGTHLNFYAYAQAGMSLKVTQNNTIIIGAPGLLQWTGGIVEYRFSTDVNSIYLNKRSTVNPYFTKDVGPDDYLASESGDLFHEGSKITFRPDNRADFFGYTVIFGESGLIVGAPRASISQSSMSSGVVFTCSLENLETRNVTCQPLKLESDGRFSSTRDFFRDDMWFGATMAVVPDKKLLICAPRFAKPYRDRHLLANGACYLQTKRQSLPIYPLREMKNQAYMTNGLRKEYGAYGTHLNFYAYAQAGMSLKVTQNNTIIIGAPGLLQWTGGIVEYRFSTDVNSIYLNKRSTVNPYFTKDVGPDDYLGYSVESGIFEDGGSTLYVAGAPRARQGFGQVLVFEPPSGEVVPLKIRAKLEGPQLGAYFGASLCCMDINRDGRTDVLVGAPNYIGKGEEVYDQGAVFVYLNKEEVTGFILDYAGRVSGSEAVGARFGSTIADLGDVDGDGFRDVAVGAPWENDGVGAVYIYRGDQHGIRNQYVQRITAKEARSLGMSIANGHDVDGNKCNDLAIGAHATGTAYIYRCIPTMHVHANIKIPEAVDLPQNATNFTAVFCVKVPPMTDWPHVGIELMASIVVDPEGNRAMLTGESDYTVVAKPGMDACQEQVVAVTPTADLSRPIAIKFDLKPIETMTKDSPTFLNNAARLSEESNLHSEFDIQLTRDCGEDLICRPWLEMTLAALDSPYIPGTQTRLGALITVRNVEEPAYGIRVHLTLPAQPKRVPQSCNLQGLNMTCNLPSPLFRHHSVTWEVELEYTLNVTDEDELLIDAVIEDPVFLRNVSDEPTQELNMLIIPEAIFSISGKALPNATVAVSREKLAEGSLIAFAHYFEVINAGPSDWPTLDARLHLPEKVVLSTPIEGCVTDFNATILECTWSVPANVSLPIVLLMKFDLKMHGKPLEEDMTENLTTILLLYEQNKTTHITTTLALDPAPPIWPLIVGVVTGLILLAVIAYGLYKYGFFSRKRVEDFKKQQDAVPLQDPGSSSTPPSTPPSPENHSTKELILMSDTDSD